MLNRKKKTCRFEVRGLQSPVATLQLRLMQFDPSPQKADGAPTEEDSPCLFDWSDGCGALNNFTSRQRTAKASPLKVGSLRLASQRQGPVTAQRPCLWQRQGHHQLGDCKQDG